MSRHYVHKIQTIGLQVQYQDNTLEHKYVRFVGHQLNTE